MMKFRYSVVLIAVIFYCSIGTNGNAIASPHSAYDLSSSFYVSMATPPAPTILGTVPASPSGNPSPQINGVTDPGASVAIYKNGICTGVPAATTIADGSGMFSVIVSATPNAVTTFTARATDGTGTSPCSSPITYLHDNIPPGKPIFTGSVPISPATSTAPVIKGTAEPNSLVRIYLGGSCSGSPAGTGSADGAGNFSIIISVPLNASTIMTATATDAAFNGSFCSDPFAYISDNAPPGVPVFTGTMPVSPANNRSPHLLGTTEPNASVSIYTDDACGGSPVATGTANGGGAFDIMVTVANNSTTTFYAHATDVAGNISSCTQSGITYVDDHNLPTGSICGIKYLDLNSNGIFEPGLGETPLAGWIIHAISSEGDTLTAVTGVGGSYCFTNVTDTLYKVVESLQAGFVQTGGQPYYTLHMLGSTINGTDFGNFRTGKIYGTKFNDIDGDGTQQGNEPGILDWPINLIPKQLPPNLDQSHSSGTVRLSFNGGDPASMSGHMVVHQGTIEPPGNTIPIEMLALELRSTAPIEIGSSFFDVFFHLDPAPQGRQFGQVFPNGPATNSFFDVFFEVELKEVGGPGNMVLRNNQPLHLTGTPNSRPSVVGSLWKGMANVQLFDVFTNQFAGVLDSFSLGEGIPISPTAPLTMKTDSSGNYCFMPLFGGKYNVREASQPCWTQTTLNPSTITIASGDSAGNINFGNQPRGSRVCLVKYYDENHNQQVDPGEQPMAGVQFNLNGASPVHAYSATTDLAGRLCFDNLPPDTYVLTEVIPQGYEVSVPKSGFYTFNFIDCQEDSVVWLNAAAYTDSLFRTATIEQWALAMDQAGKYKSVKCKPDKVDFVFNLNYRLGILKMKFPMLTSGVMRVGKNNNTIPVSSWDNLKDVTLDLTGVNAAGQILEFTGRGFKGKPISVSYQWNTPAGALIDKGSLPKGPSLPQDSLKVNLLRLPMPNLYNIGEDLERKGAFPITIGASADSHSVIHPKFKDVLKSLVKFGVGGPMFHTDSTNCLGKFLTGKTILKQQKSLPPSKANSRLFAEVLALKLNIIASQRGQFPVGLDTLVYDYYTMDPGNPLNNKTVGQICIQADSILDCYTDPKGLHLLPVDYFSVVHRINSAFASNIMDTVSWSCGKLILKGVRPLKSVPFLFARPGSISGVIVPFISAPYVEPETYKLAQNYPNPFNPTTTIQFSLPEPAVVTLKVYNMLGQEIATLIDEQDMEDGIQEVDFDASGLTSGVYFYRMVAQGVDDPDEGTIGKRYVEVKKMMLMK